MSMNKFEVRWTEDDRPQVRRADKASMTEQDRQEAKALLDKMLRHEVCWNCGREWTPFTTYQGKNVRVCWGCAKTT